MAKKIITVSLTVLFVGLFMHLFQSDNYLSFIPLIYLLKNGDLYIRAYDFFFVVLGVIIMGMYKLYGIYPKTLLREIGGWFRNLQAWELGIMAGAGVATYYYANPFLLRLFDEPVSALLGAPDPIRLVFMASLPFWWLLVIGLISKSNLSQPKQSMPSNQGMQMPQPPWTP